MSGEGRCVVRDANANGAAVARWLVNAVGDPHAAGIGEKVVIVHQDRRAAPFDATVFEVANHLAFLAVDADDGKTLALEVRSEQMCWNC